MRRPASLILAAVLSQLACGRAAPTDPGNAKFSYRPSVEQIDVWKAQPGAPLRLEEHGKLVASATADQEGSYIFRKLAPGDDYIVRSGDQYTRALEVMSVQNSTPPESFYQSQKLHPGFQYLTMRDGTKLSAYITLPGDPADGPYPTVVDYSGYSPSKPGQPIAGYQSLCPEIPTLCNAPNDPSALFMSFMSYATISVNIRGTGCSGGAYDYFEPLELLDGYDVIQIAAAQPWVLNHKVGMVGLSYPGITQLFVAETRPPGLAAITPLSVIGNTATTLEPGGILNDGFAIEWLTNVLDKAVPYGQGWEKSRVDAGDKTCEDNQYLHSQKVDNVAEARAMPYYDPKIVDPLNPETFVNKIDVPVFLAGAWQDEQTGPYFADLLGLFKDAPEARFYAHNGVHPDQFAPAIFYEWKSFLDLFVAKQVPTIPKTIRGLAPMLFDQVFYTNTLTMPPDRFTNFKTYADALAAWEKEPPLHILFESGAGDPNTPGSPVATFEKTYPAWPPPSQQAERWYFEPDGSLGDAQPTATGAASEFVVDLQAGERGILAPGGNVWDLMPAYDWRQPAPGSAVVAVSAPLAKDLLMAGTGSVDLWIRSSATEADLEVNLSEVRPDGQEMYVQSGWLRASQRKLAANATELDPRHTHYQADVQPLVPGQWVEARVRIAPFAHAFRTGSRIRLSVDTPGDSRAEWKFALAKVPAGSTVDVGEDGSHPSSVALPVLEGETVPTPLPPCSLRGQQCRDYQAYDDVPAPP